MHEPNRHEPRRAESVDPRKRRKIPMILTILLALGFGAAIAMVDGSLAKEPLNPFVILVFVAKALSHAIIPAALLEAVNWLWTRLAK